ncbi:hypothetical protein DSO57_1005635 [Entomophthora muscae]|uniref:Uncharacterized protein n=1 Tax=Entomophthora muscae TaxID=34485 RepID=A0ACC2SAD8_9FUNG|nr:hypothetical protein DSO57_1005635 [Entomophthora muscae]
MPTRYLVYKSNQPFYKHTWSPLPAQLSLGNTLTSCIQLNSNLLESLDDVTSQTRSRSIHLGSPVSHLRMLTLHNLQLVANLDPSPILFEEMLPSEIKIALMIPNKRSIYQPRVASELFIAQRLDLGEPPVQEEGRRDPQVKAAGKTAPKNQAELPPSHPFPYPARGCTLVSRPAHLFYAPIQISAFI